MMMKKILVVCDGFLPPKAKVAGGKNIYLLQKYLAANGFQMHLAVLLDKETSSDWRVWVEKEEEKFKFKFHVFNIPFKRIYPLHFLLKKISAFFIILSLHRRYKFDLVHEYSSMPFLANLTYLSGWLTHTKTVHTFCTVNKSILASERLLFKPTHQLICTCENKEQEISKRFKKRTQLIPIPVDDKFFNFTFRSDFKQQYGIGQEKVVLFCGPLDQHKGITTFIAAVPEILKVNPDAAIVILTAPGLNTFSAALKNLRKVRALAVAYAGRVFLIDQEVDMPGVLSIADVYVYPLSTMHGTLGSPSILIESMAMGKAIVASRLLELLSIIEDGKNALFFTPKDIVQLASKINQFLLDEDLRIRLGGQAKLDSKKYSISVIGSSISSLYNALFRDTNE